MQLSRHCDTVIQQLHCESCIARALPGGPSMQTLAEYGYAAYQPLSIDDDEGGQRHSL